MTFDVEETLKRIEKHPGVEGYIITNKDGVPLRSSFTNERLKNEYARYMTELADRTRSIVRDIKVTVSRQTTNGCTTLQRHSD